MKETPIGVFYTIPPHAKRARNGIWNLKGGTRRANASTESHREAAATGNPTM
jgi:hypothetical protein